MNNISAVGGNLLNANALTKLATEETAESGSPTFLDIFKNIATQAYDAEMQKNKDMIDVAIGNVDSIERIQANLAKAEVSLQLLTTVKNSVVDAYNEILRMSV
jgi:flagellar hook-basal body complex protein FliE